MTKQRIPDASKTISPCPECGVAPDISSDNLHAHPKCTHISIGVCLPIYKWNKCCNHVLGNTMRNYDIETMAQIHEAAALRSACRELGIETVEQLKAKVQPDPRVALLDELGLHSIDDVRSVVGKAVAYNRQTHDPRVAYLDKMGVNTLSDLIMMAFHASEYSDRMNDPRVAVLDRLGIKTDTEIESLFVQAVMGLRYSQYYAHKMSQRDLKMLIIDRKYDAIVDALPLDTIAAQRGEGV